MTTKKTAASYSPEVRERAVRLVLEGGGEHPTQWSAINSVAGKIGCTLGLFLGLQLGRPLGFLLIFRYLFLRLLLGNPAWRGLASIAAG